ncbi:LCP family protein [Phyllobacterium lublinensis]|uniref:LCP family protein n=1 Tax=Phyllobacterium lublinensis TaxID=2875708 RepID=UPI001CCE366F|nr:LCP family protein [Phyllobacterium sp. 2063]
MSSGPNDGSAPKGKLQPRHWLSRLALVTTIILVITGLAYAKLSGNITHVEIAREDLGDVRPPKPSSPVLNILVIGSDQRAGNDTVHGDFSGQRADTIMLVHLSHTRNDVTIVSFPRDSLVQLPACRSREGLPGQKKRLGMINASFNLGGIACIWKTVENLTGIHIDHVIKFDFAGFKEMVDALGGVNLCFPEAVRDTYGDLDLPAGLQTLQGDQALAYVRARHGLGDGSDIGRIQRQQQFFAAMVKKAVSAETLFNPVRLLRFLNAATKSVTADPGLTPGVLVGLAVAARGLSSDSIHFVTTPWRYSAIYPGRVEWVKGPARKLFRLIAVDQPLIPSKAKGVQPAAAALPCSVGFPKAPALVTTTEH